MLEGAAANNLNSRTKLNLKSSVATARSIKNNSGDPFLIAQSFGSGINPDGFSLNAQRNERQKEEDKSAIEEEYKFYRNHALGIGHHLGDYGATKEEAIANYTQSAEYRLSLRTSQLQATIDNDDADRESKSEATFELSRQAANVATANIFAVGDRHLKNASGNIDGIKVENVVREITLAAETEKEILRSQFSGHPDILDTRLKQIDEYRDQQIAIYDGKNVGRRITNDQAALQQSIDQKYKATEAEIGEEILKGRLHMSKVEQAQAVTKALTEAGELHSVYLKGRDDYQEVLALNNITGKAFDAALEEYDNNFNDTHDLLSSSMYGATHGMLSYMRGTLKEKKSIQSAYDVLLSQSIAGVIPPETMISFAEAMDQFDRIGTPSQKRAFRQSVINGSANPAVSKLVSEIPQLRNIVPEARLAIQESIIEPLDPVLKILSSKSVGFEAGEVGTFIRMGDYMVLDQDVLNNTGRLELKLKEKTYLAIDVDGIAAVDEAKTDANRILSSVDYPTYMESYKNFSGHKTNTDVINDIIGGNNLLRGLMSDDLEPEVLGSKARTRLQKLFGTEDVARENEAKEHAKRKAFQESLEAADAAVTEPAVSDEELNAIALGLATGPDPRGEE